MSDAGTPVPPGFEPMGDAPADDFGQDLLAQYAQRDTPTEDAELEAQIAAQLGEMVGNPEASTAPVDSPQELPGATAEGIPAESPAEQPADSAGLPPPEPGTEQEPPAGGYVWNWVDEATQEARSDVIPDEQVRNALLLAAEPRVHQGLALMDWAAQLTPAQRAAMGKIVDGQSELVDRAEYDRYQAWLHQQETASRFPDLDSFDPDAARIIREQQAQLAQLQAQRPPAPPADYNPQAAQLAQGYSQAIAGLQQAWHLTPAETDQLYAAAKPFIAGLQMEHTEWNPITGGIIRHADPGTVMYEAFDYAIRRNPALFEAVRGRTQTPVVQPTSSAAQTLPARDVSGKRARAASMAAAPSAAVTPSPRSIKSLTDQELNEAMAGELDAFLAGMQGQSR